MNLYFFKEIWNFSWTNLLGLFRRAHDEISPSCWLLYYHLWPRRERASLFVHDVIVLERAQPKLLKPKDGYCRRWYINKTTDLKQVQFQNNVCVEIEKPWSIDSLVSFIKLRSVYSRWGTFRDKKTSALRQLCSLFSRAENTIII